MSEKHIYKALKQLQNNKLKTNKLTLICDRLTTMGLVKPILQNDSISKYELTINGKIFIWDNENWKL